jgi:carbon-monoxide dehydrogenase iron sulfur subunit
MKTVFVNPERCVGCKQCEVACAVEHSRSKDLYQAVFEMPKPRPRIHVGPGVFLNSSFPNKCRHCDPAPCMAVCPTAAISRDLGLEIVTIDESKCITCAMCAMVCPFDVIRYYQAPVIQAKKPVALKCDHCIERQRQGGIPACVEVCKAGALVFGDVNELIRAASSRLAKAVSVAAGEIRVEMPRLPAHYEAWRAWGESVGKVNER